MQRNPHTLYGIIHNVYNTCICVTLQRLFHAIVIYAANTTLTSGTVFLPEAQAQ